MFDFSDLEKFAKEMKNAYDLGNNAVESVNHQSTKNINPDHIVDIKVNLKANIDGKMYKVDSHLLFEIELNQILPSTNCSSSDLNSLINDLGIDLGEDKDAVLNQLSNPRTIGRLREIKKEFIEVYDSNKKLVKVNLNKNAVILATLKNNILEFNFEGVFTYPKNSNLLIALPSTQKMQENIQVNLNKLEEKIEFNWLEKEKDDLKVSGELQIKKIK